ncbi:MAG TPA: AI-2E family transporter [Rhizomicrobium sp.]|nr:AI-2E family transporter [Rhizomicrobium sp.]
MYKENAVATLRKAVIWIGTGAIIFILWRVRLAVLVALGAVLIAILLHLIAHLFRRTGAISQNGSLVLAIVLVAAILLLCGWLFGSRVTSEFVQLGARLPQGGRSLGTLVGLGAKNQVTRDVSLVAGMLPGLMFGSLRVFEYLIVTAIASIYLAAQPALYRDGIGALFPDALRARTIAALNLVGVSLKLWMTGQSILMISVGILSFGAALLVGLPDPIALGLIAGISELVPYLGPFLGAIPAILVALTLGLAPALWIAASYLVIHLFEGYLAGPLLQRWFVHIPPPLILVGIVACQQLFGIAGFILATPLTIIVHTAIKFFYQGVVLRQTVDVPTSAPF